ncbi:MAG: hypothetical protein Q9181_007603 [Wetmoreana brouardii]
MPLIYDHSSVSNQTLRGFLSSVQGFVLAGKEFELMPTKYTSLSEALDELSLDEVAAKLGQSPQLHMVSLLSMADSVAMETQGDPYLNANRHKKAARFFIQRVPDHLLESKTFRGIAIAWNKQDFIPAYDLEWVCDA